MENSQENRHRINHYEFSFSCRARIAPYTVSIHAKSLDGSCELFDGETLAEALKKASDFIVREKLEFDPETDGTFFNALCQLAWADEARVRKQFQGKDVILKRLDDAVATGQRPQNVLESSILEAMLDIRDELHAGNEGLKGLCMGEKPVTPRA